MPTTQFSYKNSVSERLSKDVDQAQFNSVELKVNDIVKFAHFFCLISCKIGQFFRFDRANQLFLGSNFSLFYLAKKIHP